MQIPFDKEVLQKFRNKYVTKIQTRKFESVGPELYGSFASKRITKFN
jgi:hypothetical protein